MDSKNEEFLGVDVGGARVGIARGSSAAKIAEPLETVPAGEAPARLGELARGNKAAGIVVGLPRSLDGRETVQTRTVRAWVKAAQAKIGLDFYWQDEALTTVSAGGGADVDAKAAAIILQDFLDTPKEERVRC
ncbi:MAG TPA: Holliday junction resolvase RuvX [Candidatus Saccharimonadales bacterium]|nr:Holliday junction resolvase RuvX [Candidatus Saccharimonadales bacterium]